MHKTFRPNQLLNSVYDIDLRSMYLEGYRHVLLDLDNTLVPWNEIQVPSELTQWFEKLHGIGFDAIVISNNKQERVEPVARALGISYLAQAGKPGKGAALRALAMLHADPQCSFLVGDQLITDIWTGKLAGLYTILVSPISPVEFGGTKINRLLERLLLWCMHLKRP